MQVEWSWKSGFLRQRDLKADRTAQKVIYSAYMGWLNDDPTRGEVIKHAQLWGEDIDEIIVFGTGGSRLSGWALDTVFRTLESNVKRISWIGHEFVLPPDLIQGSVRTGCILVSQSGTTLEPLSVYEEFARQTQRPFKTLVITRSGSPLWNQAQQKKWEAVEMDPTIGGRYSALTPAAMFPLAAAGYTFLSEFQDSYYRMIKSEWDTPYVSEDVGRLRLEAELRSGYHLEWIGYWNQELKGVALWLQQLIGESEGKKSTGLYPVTHRFPRDLHSIEQSIHESRARGVMHHLSFDLQPHVDGEKTSLQTLSYYTMQSVLDSHRQVTPYLCHWVFSQHQLARDLGEFMAYWHLIVSDTGFFKDINPFDQPSVELYKTRLRDYLK